MRLLIFLFLLTSCVQEVPVSVCNDAGWCKTETVSSAFKDGERNRLEGKRKYCEEFCKGFDAPFWTWDYRSGCGCAGYTYPNGR